MKKTMFIIMAITTLAVTAQQKDDSKKHHRKHLMENLTPEQKAEIQSKKLTLDLNLNNAQQSKIKELLVDAHKERTTKAKTKENLTDAEKLKLKSDRLDNQIAMKRAMKDILTEEQFSKWEKRQSYRMRKFKSRKEAKKHHRNREN